jgi:hypothetical protein
MLGARVVEVNTYYDEDFERVAHYRCVACWSDISIGGFCDFRIQLVDTESGQGFGHLCDECSAGGPNRVASKIKERTLHQMESEIKSAEYALKRAREKKDESLQLASRLEDEEVQEWVTWRNVVEAEVKLREDRRARERERYAKYSKGEGS